MSERKADHLRIAGEPGVQHTVTSGLERVRLRHRALPESDLEAVSLRTRLLDRTLQAPLVISAMTGGTPEAEQLNRRLLRAAAEHGIALVLGSARKLLDDEERPPLLLTGLGAVEVTGREGAWRAEHAVELLDADGLAVHLNPLQEAVQAEGAPAFAGVLEGIAAAVARIAPRPVVVTEAGFGLDFDDVAALRDAGVAAVDVAGAGGASDALAGEVAQAFAGWGTPTADALADARAAAPGLPVIASGGIRDGVDVAKCLALGATAAGIAAPLLTAAREDRASEVVAIVTEQLRIATWLTGASGAQELGREHLR